MSDQILDYDDHYNEKEQAAYDHGCDDGFKGGFIWGSGTILIIVILLWI